jgi:hypothetical protein
VTASRLPSKGSTPRIPITKGASAVENASAGHSTKLEKLNKNTALTSYSCIATSAISPEDDPTVALECSKRSTMTSRDGTPRLSSAMEARRERSARRPRAPGSTWSGSAASEGSLRPR